jgi:hypothetical protein
MADLVLCGNKIAGSEGGRILSDMVEHNTVLTNLDVSSNCTRLGDDGPGFVQALSLGLKNNSSLVRLKITNNQIGETLQHDPKGLGVVALAKAIRSHVCILVSFYLC